MLQSVQMKEVAIAKLEVEKDKARIIIQALDNSIETMNKEYPEEKQQQICALMDLRYVFESILGDFRETIDVEGL